jgi:cytochrome c peroxidase
MEKRRTGLWFIACAVLSFPAWACNEGTRLESPRYVLAYKAEALAVAKHFSVDVAICPKAGQPEAQALKVDAHMPEHRHGMNYAPVVKALGRGRWRAEGLMLHMPGRWEFVFEVRAAGATDRLANTIFVTALLDFSKDELARILQHGPWPPPLKPDPSNRVSGKPEAIALGEKLFFEPRLSGTGSVLCATCHAPFRHFQDARARAFGLELVDRNTPTVVNARFYRWFGWDGAQDSLWAQSIRPLLDQREMNASAAHVAKTVRTLFPKEYEAAFGRRVPAQDEELLVDVGKALAAYQETWVSGRTPFDDFRDALQRGESDTAYPVAAQRGLRIFVGKGNCNVCHLGPQFTNSEFADTGVPFFIAPGKVDPGRQRKAEVEPVQPLGTV